MTGALQSHAGTVSAAEREWLILVYVSGVNDRGIAGFAKDSINRLEKVGSSDKVTIVVKYNILGTGKGKELQFQQDAKTVLIRGDKGDQEITSPVVDRSKQTDMASSLNLSLFVRKSLARFPSKKVMLVLWGKGEGFRGALDDDVSGKRMSIQLVTRALSEARKGTHRRIDVLALDADMMQMAEVIYELKDEADIVVGSEEAGSGVHYLYDLALQEVIDDPTTNPASLAGAMVYFAESPVSSAVRTGKIEGFVRRLDAWTELIMKDPSALKAAAAALDATFHLAMRDSKDLCDLIERVVASVHPDSSVAKTGKDLERYIRQELILATHWSIEPGTPGNRPYNDRSHGLAIYLPDLVYNSNAYEPLGFASHSQWPRFLLSLLQQRLKK